jgi:GAF domain-containing protein
MSETPAWDQETNPGLLAVYLRQLQAEKKRADDLLNIVIPVATALSVEQDFNRLLERILLEAKALCGADAGTLYLRTPDDRLQFMIVRTTSLGLALGGTTDRPVPFPPLRLYDEATGAPNERNVATYTVLRGAVVNLPDVGRAEGFDFSGTRAFDRLTGYRSISLLTIPLRHGPERVTGVIQLLNALAPDTGQIIPFDPALHPVVEALASLAAIALDAYQREQGLRQQIQALRIEIDQAKKARQVAEITETDYFRRLQDRARTLRARTSPTRPPEE